ncbi:DegT/DnrJ/EryC1/StrS family aminotransferase [Pseudoalteromonas sp. OOF1S-7]|uniref:DegT/DnrJ/EryC1/StrS family aminotransferase n=1 Tax=Pseudoalteromonas sp. OOF1S-7 TaxID=2917757 RepID=UPI001EF5F751|nr:DegT/DnrJ/EryC1/StrS family aminotransferase [Pseudoalteromonas sp. OOF1S-7]MCG7537121.1 DegT/DnrJ/EryC1/StrS family aminotransferase [Pseudoalteromonas sp. OOF1S-7]
MGKEIPFVDLPYRYAKYKAYYHQDLDIVLNSGQFILGNEVTLFEQELAAYHGASHAVGVGNGTDALILALQAFGIGSGDEVITTPMSYLASTSSIVMAGAKPVFADVDNSLNLCPDSVALKITAKTKAILVVHLSGNPADIVSLRALADQHGLILIEDCAQAIGATVQGKKVGTFGDAACFSFHPLKNIGGIGDGGAIILDSEEHARWLKIARNHGHANRDECSFWSVNSRLDALQARFLMTQLNLYEEELTRRQGIARIFCNELSGVVQLPDSHQHSQSSYNWFMILAEHRNELCNYLKLKGIETKIHYPKLIPQLHAARSLDVDSRDFSNAIELTKRILSLPIAEHIGVSEAQHIANSIKEFYVCKK